MKNTSILLLIGLLLFAFSACSKDVRFDKTEKVQVTVHLTSDPPTRSVAGLKPEVENLLYNVAVFQYNSEGILIGQDYQTVSFNNLGVMEATPTFTLTAASNCTLCLLANISEADYNRGTAFWGDNLTAYKSLLFDLSTVVINAEADGDEGASTRVPRMMMNGYCVSDVSASQQLNVTMGRMMTKLTIVLKNETGADISDGTVTLTNIPGKAYVFPQPNAPALPSSAYIGSSLSDTGVSIANNGSATMYYYMAPNYCTSEAKATTLTVTAGGESGTIVLGNNAPGSSPRNYDLFPNNIYTFTLTLK